MDLVRTMRTRITANPHVSALRPVNPGTSSLPSGNTDEDSNDGVCVNESIFRNFGVKISLALGDLVSHRLEKSFGPLLADANADQALKAEVAELKGKLEVARSRNLIYDQVKQEYVAVNTTIGRLEADLKAARQDVSIRAKQDKVLEAHMKSLSGQMEALKVGSDATIAKLWKELNLATAAADS
ncbi:hypothetical protein R1sor_003029 [Riccia sorocarpa]|uniref:Uncharacterized protein n=1 Tax=Riccia sorocarpa TaxID=122646 RepID=A0ABD3H0G1_9MARC